MADFRDGDGVVYNCAEQYMMAKKARARQAAAAAADPKPAAGATPIHARTHAASRLPRPPHPQAQLFGDDATLAEILACRTPKQQKALGRSVQGFDEALWCSKRSDIVAEGSRWKFRSSAELRRALFSTGNRQLVEASAYDK